MEKNEKNRNTTEPQDGKKKNLLPKTTDPISGDGGVQDSFIHVNHESWIIGKKNKSPQLQLKTLALYIQKYAFKLCLTKKREQIVWRDLTSISTK